MTLTKLQKEILLIARMAKVHFRQMYVSKHELGYASKGTNHAYDINVASDAPTKDVRDIVLIHEASHLYLKHTEVSIKNEMPLIDELLKKHNKTVSQLNACYGGPMNFLNICMDLEINSNILTMQNVREMNKYFDICTPEKFGVEVLDNFRDYYEPLIKRISEDIESARPDMQDMPTSGDGEDLSSLPDELKDAIRDEYYRNGNDKAQANDIVKESTVKNEKDSIESSDSKNSYFGNGKSFTGNSSLKIEVKENNDRSIKEFLRKILDINKSYKQDATRHYNRGTRDRSSGILYSSKRLSRTWENRKKIAFLVDVSGSMYIDSIIKAASSLKECLDVISPDSSLVTWDTGLSEEFNITDIPKYIKTGGGTDIASGLNYLSDKGFTDIVIYSDFETDMNAMRNSLKKTSARVYSIVVNNMYSTETIVTSNLDFFKKTPFIVVV